MEFNLENGFDFLSLEYELLFDDAGASPFQHPVWLQWFYRSLVPAVGAEPAVLVGRWSRDGQLAMLVPLVRRRLRGLRVVEFADLGVADYAAPVCRPETLKLAAKSADSGPRVQALLKPFDILRIKNIPDWATPFEGLFGATPRQRMEISSHAVSLGDSFEAWRAECLRPSFAKELAKKRRQVERLGALRLERVQEPSDIESLMRELRSLRGTRYPNDVLGQPHHFEFYRKVAVDGSARGLARAYRVTVGGRSAGGLWGLAHRRRFMVLISAMDYEALGRHSIGSLAFEDLARDCIGQGDTVLDFTTGDEAYKQRFGTSPTAMWMAANAGTGIGRLAQAVASTMPRPGARQGVRLAGSRA